jgi:hypothetical protein
VSVRTETAAWYPLEISNTDCPPFLLAASRRVPAVSRGPTSTTPRSRSAFSPALRPARPERYQNNNHASPAIPPRFALHNQPRPVSFHFQFNTLFCLLGTCLFPFVIEISISRFSRSVPRVLVSVRPSFPTTRLRTHVTFSVAPRVCSTMPDSGKYNK